jgi:hypothetical protein
MLVKPRQEFQISEDRQSVVYTCERVIFNEMSVNESVGELLITPNGFSYRINNK